MRAPAVFKRFPARGAASPLVSSFLAFATLCFFLGCGGSIEPSAEEKLRAEACPAVRSAKTFEETPFNGGESAQILSFQTIRSRVNAACAGCHMAPSRVGGFSYADEWKGRELTVNGESAFYPGFFEAGEKMRDYLRHPDPARRMPPLERRTGKPEVFLELADHLQKWIDAGKPNGTFKVGVVSGPAPGKPRPTKPNATSELGDCVPTAKAAGSDYKTDRRFETMTELPKFLTETDLTTLDSYELAKKGTFAYNVEYPLWADNAEKGRWIHVPMKIVDGQVRRQSVDLDPVTRQFIIPENTRFYKMFYRAVTLPNKKIKMRRMETRLIVARTPWEKSLFGTYQWDESEQIAMLVDAPYRDGTAWKDLVFDVVVDENKGKVRPYAIPGRSRCIDCHMGSPMGNFVLGFQPLQINKRPLGGAGRLEAPLEHDLNQVDRFISYGLLKGINSGRDLPVLEGMGTLPPRDEDELRANGYTVGNCYHCHNPKGLAFTPENGVQLRLGPGDLFGFSTQQKSVQIPSRRLVHQNGDLDGSQIWRKISDTPQQLGMTSQMPMHTPGAPDCHVLTVMGKWIRGFESPQAALEWQPNCKKENPFFWIDSDFTQLSPEFYVPRRADWKDPVQGMTSKYRDIELTPELAEAIRSRYPVGYWRKKPVCQFPNVDLPPEQRLPWMMKGDKPKQPFGEIYYTTPGSYLFRNTCYKCHGPKADGDSAYARGIMNWSGGKVRVADLINGMFGRKGENLKNFDLDGKNYAGNYLIWMAMEGTRVQFPPELSSLLGKHGGQMLNGVREKCLAQISTDKPSSPNYVDHEMMKRVCFMNNLEPGHPDLVFDGSTNEPRSKEKVEAWLDHATWNAGWAIFDFLKRASQDEWPAAVDQCELVYPAKKPERSEQMRTK